MSRPALLAFALLLPAAASFGDVVITEFMASNGETLTTANGGRGLDWIELHNTGETNVDLVGWHLFDDPTKKVEKWTRIEGPCVIPAGGYRIVWADKNYADFAPDEAHVALGISADADSDNLFLAQPDGTKVFELGTYPGQLEDISYGVLADGGGLAYFRTPTPGAANGTTGAAPPTPAVTLSAPHGFRTEPFELTLACADGSATPIYYTTDGSVPSAANGTLYTGPLTISKTTCLRAVASVPDAVFENIACATYLFVADVVERPYSFERVKYASGERAQDLERGFTFDRVSKAAVAQALSNSLATISIVTDERNLFDLSTGIYCNASKEGREWERPVSVELIDPKAGADGEFTVPAGLRIRGASSSAFDHPKHSFRLYFRSEYGAGELKFGLFGDEGVKKFKKMDLRTGQNNSWANEQSDWETFAVETFSRDAQRDQGQPYTRSRWYHLYLNGEYWGLYETQERADDDFAASYLGGSASDWDVIKTEYRGQGVYGTACAEGTPDAWNDFVARVNAGVSSDTAYLRLQGLNADGARNPDYPVYLDVDNLIDYVLNTEYANDPDCPWAAGYDHPNNMYALRNRNGERGFVWLRYDAEHSLGLGPHARYPNRSAGVDGNGLAWGKVTGSFTNGFADKDPRSLNPVGLHWRLMENARYRQRFVTRAYAQLFAPDAVFSVANAQRRFRDRMDEVADALDAEIARWGRGTKDRATWQTACDEVLNAFIARRLDYLKRQYVEAGWYPTLDPDTVDCLPKRSAWRFFDRGTSPAGDWKGAGYDDADWSSGRGVLGFGAADVATETARFVGGVRTNGQVRTAYFRTTLADDPQLASATNLVLDVRFDDGYILYLNGVEIDRLHMTGRTGRYEEFATALVSPFNGEGAYVRRTLHLPPGLLKASGNVLACEVHQRYGRSADLAWDCAVQARVLPPADVAPSPTDALPGLMPVAVTGFSRDVLAESAPSSSSLALTRDDEAVSAADASFPADGRLADGDDVYQLGAFSAANALVLASNDYARARGFLTPNETLESGTLTLIEPACYQRLSVLYSGHGDQSVRVRIDYVDGSDPFETSFAVRDWCTGGSSGRVLAFRRLIRSTGKVDTSATPAFYRADISGFSTTKAIRALTFSRIGKDSRQVGVFAVSGVADEHRHDWAYAVDEARIEVLCRGTYRTDACAHCQDWEKALVLDVIAPDRIYDGQPAEVTLDDGLTPVRGGEGPAVAYVGIHATAYARQATAPCEPGTYRAEVTVAGVTAAADFCIYREGEYADDIWVDPPAPGSSCPLAIADGFNVDLVAEDLAKAGGVLASGDWLDFPKGALFFSSGVQASGALPDGRRVESADGTAWTLASYDGPNALRLGCRAYSEDKIRSGDWGEGDVHVESGTLVLTAPQGDLGQLRILCTGSNDGIWVDVTVNYADGTSSAPILRRIPDWGTSSGRILSCGRISCSGSSVVSSGFGFFELAVPVAAEKEVASVSFAYVCSARQGSTVESPEHHSSAGSVFALTGIRADGSNPHPFGAMEPFANDPVVVFTAVSPEGFASGTSGGTLSLTVAVKDGEVVKEVIAEKVAEGLEATSDLADWVAGRLSVSVVAGSIRQNPDKTVSFTLQIGDGSSPQAFIRARGASGRTPTAR